MLQEFYTKTARMGNAGVVDYLPLRARLGGS